ncbi:A/G-specific adenine glycosylase [Desulfolutivibrio sulfodismutans]|nr:A/G-specific adenine glycosylase [Desulfolutivibrio sulfodismutans]
MSFTARLLSWYAANSRPLPWRENPTPYRVLVSEVMLQQTQAARAAVYFQRFVARFPDFSSLADADPDQVLKLWEGLGYYSRARNLQAAAKIIAGRGVFPDTLEGIAALPGVGPYTAGAVAALALGLDHAAVDANVERVLSRSHDIDAPIKERQGRERVRELAAALLPPGRAGDFFQALMELGEVVCRPKNPACGLCPVADLCQARHLGIVAERPVRAKGKSIELITVATAVFRCQGLIFIQRRRPGGAWGNLWEFPGGRVEAGEAPEDAAVRELSEETGFSARVEAPLGVIRHGYTTYRVTLHCYLLAPADPTLPGLPFPVLTAAVESRWASLADLDGLAFPAGHRKLIDSLRADLRFF